MFAVFESCARICAMNGLEVSSPGTGWQSSEVAGCLVQATLEMERS